MSFSTGATEAFVTPVLADGGGPTEVLTDEAFSLTLNPDERAPAFVENFLLSLRGLANSTSYSEVMSPARDKVFLRFFAPPVFFVGGGVIDTPVALRFFGTRAMGSGRG
jgi:hypothetical protein